MPSFKPRYTVIHDGVIYKPGHPVEVSDRDAATLGAFGEITAVKKAPVVAAHKKTKRASEEDDII